MGYFGIGSKFCLKKLIAIHHQILFYSLTGMFIGLLFGVYVGFQGILESVFPVALDMYWFMTAYVIVYILSPYFNAMLNHLSNEQYISLIIICLLFWSIIPFFSANTSEGMQLNQLIWFGITYVMGGYIRRYHSKHSQIFWKKVLFASVILLIVGVVGITVIEITMNGISTHGNYISWSNTPFSIAISISSFTLAKEADIRSRNMNRIASGVLGVYLFHENPYFREILWGKLLHNEEFYGSWVLIVDSIVVVAITFFIGSLIELMRRKISMLEFFQEIQSKETEVIERKFNNIIERIGG